MSKFKIGDSVCHFADTTIPGTIKHFLSEDRVLVDFGHYGDKSYPIKYLALTDTENETVEQSEDMVNHPDHYTSDKSGVECITVTRHRNFNVGNAIKYLWRAGLKKDSVLKDSAKQIEDLEKAVFYIKDEIERLKEW